eukprot:tig00021463_g21625.t1
MLFALLLLSDLMLVLTDGLYPSVYALLNLLLNVLIKLTGRGCCGVDDGNRAAAVPSVPAGSWLVGNRHLEIREHLCGKSFLSCGCTAELLTTLHAGNHILLVLGKWLRIRNAVTGAVFDCRGGWRLALVAG